MNFLTGKRLSRRHVLRGVGAGLALPPEALWWGWKSFAGSTTRLQKPAAPKPGEEVVLLRYETEEGREAAQDTTHPRKVVLTLKLALEAE